MNTKYQMWLTFNAEKEKIQLPSSRCTSKQKTEVATVVWIL